MKNIDYYNLNKEYPVNLKFWADFGALILYYGYYKPFKWESSFNQETLKRIYKAIFDSKEKLNKGISLLDYELAKDKLAHNYTSFRYFFERSEKISSLNFLGKINWTVEQVENNINSRISSSNKFIIKSDFYIAAYEVIYNKMIIHSYAIEYLNISPIRLIFDPLLIDNHYQNDSAVEENSQTLKCLELSYLVDSENQISLSRKFSILFENESQFKKINFSKLKEKNIIYDSSLSGFQLRYRYKGDFILFLFLLRKYEVIKEISDTYITELIKEIFDVKISGNNYTHYKNALGTGKKSKENTVAIEKCIDFINEYIIGL